MLNVTLWAVSSVQDQLISAVNENVFHKISTDMTQMGYKQAPKRRRNVM